MANEVFQVLKGGKLVLDGGHALAFKHTYFKHRHDICMQDCRAINYSLEGKGAKERMGEFRAKQRRSNFRKVWRKVVTGLHGLARGRLMKQLAGGQDPL